MGTFADIGQDTFGFFGSLIGEAIAAGDEKEAKRLREQAFNEIDSLQIPNADKLKYQAKLAEVERVGPSAMQGVKVDSAYEQAGRDTMDQLKDVAEHKGMDAQARAAQIQAEREASRQSMMEQGAIEGDAARRGIATSGLSLMARLRAQQGGADRASMAGVEAAGQGAARAVQAGQARAQVAGQLSDRSFGQQEQVAQATDAINKFNAQEANTGSRFNAGATNDASRFDSGVMSDDYNRKRQKAQDMYAAYSDRAGQYDAAAARKRRIASAGGQIIGKVGGEALDAYSGGF